jgi:excisionase family DNA binding protein
MTQVGIEVMARPRKAPALRARGEIMTTEDVARYLVCYHETVYRLIKESEFPAFKFGKAWRFIRSEVESWIDEHQVKPEQEVKPGKK